jgi:hypothetical protein
MIRFGPTRLAEHNISLPSSSTARSKTTPSCSAPDGSPATMGSA